MLVVVVVVNNYYFKFFMNLVLPLLFSRYKVMEKRYAKLSCYYNFLSINSFYI
jgi:hypothetical protein